MLRVQNTVLFVIRPVLESKAELIVVVKAGPLVLVAVKPVMVTGPPMVAADARLVAKISEPSNLIFIRLFSPFDCAPGSLPRSGCHGLCRISAWVRDANRKSFTEKYY